MDAEIIKTRVNLLDLAQRETSLKRVSSTGGGEYAGPCPWCGGDDRFRVQVQAPPGKRPEGARWMCRNCSPQWGDVIGFVQRRDNCDFQAALVTLAGDSTAAPVAPKPAPEVDRATWQNAAMDFLEKCVCSLWSDEGAGARSYLASRGLERPVLTDWLIGYNAADSYGQPQEWGLDQDATVWLPKGVVIPCMDALGLHYLKIRRRVGDPKYSMIKGSQNWLFGAQTFENVSTAFLFEGEFDAMLSWSTGLIGNGHAAMPAGQTIRSEWQPFFDGIDHLIVAYDSDDPGQQAADKLCSLDPHIIKADPLPVGKDLTEYFQAVNSMEAVLNWQLEQLVKIDES